MSRIDEILRPLGVRVVRSKLYAPTIEWSTAIAAAGNAEKNWTNKSGSYLEIRRLALVPYLSAAVSTSVAGTPAIPRADAPVANNTLSHFLSQYHLKIADDTDSIIQDWTPATAICWTPDNPVHLVEPILLQPGQQIRVDLKNTAANSIKAYLTLLGVRHWVAKIAA